MPTMAPAKTAIPRDFLTGNEWSAATTRDVFALAANVKSHPTRYAKALAGRYLALIFEKPSLRTRTTFDVGMQSLGGGAVFLDHEHTRLGERETIKDVAKNLERWVQGI